MFKTPVQTHLLFKKNKSFSKTILSRLKSKRKNALKVRTLLIHRKYIESTGLMIFKKFINIL